MKHRHARPLSFLLVVAAIAIALTGTHAAASPSEEPALLASAVTPPVAMLPGSSVSSEGMARGMKPPQELRLNLEGRDIVTIFATGDVRLGEGLTVDEAARAFWKRVGELAPGFCQSRTSSK